MQHYFGIKKNNKMLLSSDDIYHIKTVMRMKDKDNVVITENKISYLCEIENIKSDIEFSIIKQLDENKEVIPKTRLIIPLLKEQKMDYILQKSTELGVDEIIIYEAKRSVVKEKNIDKKINRWTKILKEASEQSFRSYIPTINGVFKINELNLDGIKILASTKEVKKNIKKVLKTVSTCDTINIVVGPEGGLDDTEEKVLNEMGYISVTFGTRILRVETVPLFILSIINYQFME